MKPRCAGCDVQLRADQRADYQNLQDILGRDHGELVDQMLREAGNTVV